MRSSFAPTSQSGRSVGTHRPGHTPGVSPADAEIARLFCELRRYLGLPVAQIAQHLGTHPSVIAALEGGRIDLLPGWNETARVVSSYIGLARMDPRPALHRLAMLMGVAIAPAAPAPYVPTPVEADTHNPVARILGRLSDAANRAREDMAQPGVLAEWVAHIKDTAQGVAATVRSAKAPVRWVSAAALALILVGSAAPSGVLQASVGGISEPFSGLWRKLSGEGRSFRVILRDGLRWIEADDPRERRADKLPSHRS